MKRLTIGTLLILSLKSNFVFTIPIYLGPRIVISKATGKTFEIKNYKEYEDYLKDELKNRLNLLKDANLENSFNAQKLLFKTLRQNKYIFNKFNPDMDVFNCLLERNINVNIKDKHGYTPIKYLLALFIERVSWLNDMQESKIFTDKYIKQNFDGLIALLKCQADCNIKDSKGETPLMQIIQAKKIIPKIQERLIKLLMAYGADVNIENNEGKNAIKLAIDNNLGNIAQLLNKYSITSLKKMCTIYMRKNKNTFGKKIAQLPIELQKDINMY